MLHTTPNYHWIRRFRNHCYWVSEAQFAGQQAFRTPPFTQQGIQIYPFGHLEVFFDMAGRNSGKKRFQSSDMEFINFRFSAKEKEDFRKWLSANNDICVLAIKTTVQDDNKLGISWDSANGVFIATLMGKEDSVNAGKCLLIRSEEWDRALFACAYVHEVVFQGSVWEVDKDGDLA